MTSYNKKTVEDIEVKGKKVLVRCDFNVPLADGKITDDKRIRESIKTLKYLLDNGAAVIACSHLGRPKGEFNMKYSLAPVAKRLSEKQKNLLRQFDGTVTGQEYEQKKSFFDRVKEAFGGNS